MPPRGPDEDAPGVSTLAVTISADNSSFSEETGNEVLDLLDVPEDNSSLLTRIFDPGEAVISLTPVLDLMRKTCCEEDILSLERNTSSFGWRGEVL